MKYDLTGQRFGKLRVLGRGFDPERNITEWNCLCDCGVKKVIASGSLRAGKVKSCGCQKTKGRIKDITGQKFGRLTILSHVGMAPNRVSIWLVRCDCGSEFKIRKNNLWVSADGKKNTVSCGCHRSDMQKARHLTHGEAGKRSKEYTCWQNMHQRCNNPKHSHYRWYGEKGVTICSDWSDYEQFLADVGRSPPDKQYIDRIDPYGNYEPANVRWANMETSNSNKR
jgi:hypothetical protein